MDADTDVDVDADGEPAGVLATLAAAAEPQLALRGGRAYAPRLVRVDAPARPDAPAVADADYDATVLVTGATGVVGAMVAEHVARRHGARHLLLVADPGAVGPGLHDLVADLESLGSAVTVAACDARDRAGLAEIVEAVPAGRLAAVFHVADLGADVEGGSPAPADVADALRTGYELAEALHELTATRDDVSTFALFSSAAGTVGGPGQGHRAAASAALDALAQRRRAAGLSAVSLAWGPWTGGASPDDHAGAVARLGLAPVTGEEGLELLDVALAAGGDHATVVAAPLDLPALRSRAGAGLLAPLFANVVRLSRRSSDDAVGSLPRRLAAVPEAERDALVREVVAEQVAAVLGHLSAWQVDVDRPFKELGLDSLGAVELRNRLTQVTSLALPATLVFDHPTTGAVARLVRALVEGTDGAGRVASPVATRSDEPIAIVGMGCRYPGGVGSPDDLWRLVTEGTDAVSGLPTDRGFDLERLYDPDPDNPGTSYTRHGAFLADAAGFDAGFFGIGPQEAVAMDPQQRLLLEVAWETLEHAGIDVESLRGSATGVFAGISLQDYSALQDSGRGQIEGLRLTGSLTSVISGRLAYAFGFEGPAMTIDTACSSSLVALHLACQALRAGECSLALAGGVTVMASPAMFVEFSRQRGLAPDGRCKSFAAAADGVGWAEGAGLVAVERLSDAVARGHRVLAVVRGSAVNQDGASNGLTAPNGPSQERVIRAALANAGLAPSDVDAVEAHGTGTSLGDPIEAQALLATYGQDRTDGPLRLGSVKSNIGHTQAAAGVAGVIKLVEGMRHDTLPAHVARGRAVAARGLVGRRRGVGDRGPAVDAGRAASSGGCVVVRDQWDERARDRGGGAARGAVG